MSDVTHAGEAGIGSLSTAADLPIQFAEPLVPEAPSGGYRGNRGAQALDRQTVVRLVIRHRKDLPTRIEFTDLIAQKAYDWLFSQGVEVDVTAALEMD